MSKGWIEKFLFFSIPLFLSANEEVLSFSSSMTSVQKDRSQPNRLDRLLKKRKEILKVMEGDQGQKVKKQRLNNLLKNRKKLLLALEGEKEDSIPNQVADVLEKEKRKESVVSPVAFSVRNPSGFALSESNEPDFATIYKALTQGKIVITSEQRKKVQGLLARKISLPALKEKFEKIEQILADFEPKQENGLQTIEVTEEMLVCLVFREFVQAIPRCVLKSALSDPLLLSFVDEQFKVFLKECNKRFEKYHIQIQDEGGFKAFIEKWKLILSDTENLQGIGLSHELSEISQSPACLYLSLENDEIPVSGALWSLPRGTVLPDIMLSQYDALDDSYSNSLQPFYQRSVVSSLGQPSLQEVGKMFDALLDGSIEKGTETAEFVLTQEIPVVSNLTLSGYEPFCVSSDFKFVNGELNESIERLPLQEELIVSVEWVQMDKGHIPAPMSKQFFNPRNIRFLQMIERNLEARDRLKKLESLFISHRLMEHSPYSAATLCAVPLLRTQKKLQRTPYLPQQEEVLENNQNSDIAQDHELSVSSSQWVGKRISYLLKPTIEKSSALDLLSSFLQKSLAGQDQIFPELEEPQMKQALKLFLSGELEGSQQIGFSSYRGLQADSSLVWNRSRFGLFDGIEEEKEKISLVNHTYQKQGKEWKQEVPDSYQSSVTLTSFAVDEKISEGCKYNDKFEDQSENKLSLLSFVECDPCGQKLIIGAAGLNGFQLNDKPEADQLKMSTLKSFLSGRKDVQKSELVRFSQGSLHDDFVQQQASYLLSLAERLFSQDPLPLDQVTRNQDIDIDKNLTEKGERIPENFKKDRLFLAFQDQSDASVVDLPLSFSAGPLANVSLAENPSLPSSVNAFAFVCPTAFTEQYIRDSSRSKAVIQKENIDRSPSGSKVEYQSAPIRVLYAAECVAGCGKEYVVDNGRIKRKDLEKNLASTKKIEQSISGADFQTSSLMSLPQTEIPLTQDNVVADPKRGNIFSTVSLVEKSSFAEKSGKTEAIALLEGFPLAEAKESRLEGARTSVEPLKSLNFSIPLKAAELEQNGVVSGVKTVSSGVNKIETASYNEVANNVSSPKGLAFLVDQKSPTSGPSSVRPAMKAIEVAVSSTEYGVQSEQEVQESRVMDCF